MILSALKALVNGEFVWSVFTRAEIIFTVSVIFLFYLIFLKRCWFYVRAPVWAGHHSKLPFLWIQNPSLKFQLTFRDLIFISGHDLSVSLGCLSQGNVQNLQSQDRRKRPVWLSLNLEVCSWSCHHHCLKYTNPSPTQPHPDPTPTPLSPTEAVGLLQEERENACDPDMPFVARQKASLSASLELAWKVGGYLLSAIAYFFYQFGNKIIISKIWLIKTFTKK